MILWIVIIYAHKYLVLFMLFQSVLSLLNPGTAPEVRKVRHHPHLSGRKERTQVGEVTYPRLMR